MLQKYQDGGEENLSAAMERITLSRNEGRDDSTSSQMSSNSSYSFQEVRITCTFGAGLQGLTVLSHDISPLLEL